KRSYPFSAASLLGAEQLLCRNVSSDT
uniref:Transposase n=1 Tax=Steinernema glaseri TaxID=37863 RepID=A0A1I8AAL5_9BILA